MGEDGIVCGEGPLLTVSTGRGHAGRYPQWTRPFTSSHVVPSGGQRLGGQLASTMIAVSPAPVGRRRRALDPSVEAPAARAEETETG
jgi:hypothetical protein